jgi:hypothetical protein
MISVEQKFRKIFGVPATLRDVLDAAERNPSLPRFRKQDDGELEEVAEEIAEGEGDGEDFGSSGGNGGPDTRHHVDKLADLVMQADSSLDRSQVLNWLLHSAHGNALVERMRATNKRREETPMTREQELSVIAKKYGIIAVAKHIVDDGPGGVTEFEMTKLVTAAAQRTYPELTPAAAFAKMYGANDDDGKLLRQATGACKGFQVTPAHKQAATGSAYDQLVTKADELRKREPGLSREMAFSKVFVDPANIELARRERSENRPVA